jgi:hypothetical protein
MNYNFALVLGSQIALALDFHLDLAPFPDLAFFYHQKSIDMDLKLSYFDKIELFS